MVKYNGHYYYTLAETAKILCVDESTVRKYCKSGELLAHKYFIKEKKRDLWCITKGDITKFIKNRYA